MYYKELSVFLSCLLLSGAVFAQTTTVSNSDLTKFRDRRIAAENEYRENYKRLGMPSPEEIETDRVAYINNTQEMSARLRKEQAERYAALAYESYQRQSNESYQLISGPVRFISYNGGYYTNGGHYYPYREPRWRGQQQIRWRAAGGFIFYEPGGRPSTIWSPAPVRRLQNAWRVRSSRPN